MPLWMNIACCGLVVGFTVFAWSLCKAASEAEDWDDEEDD